MSILALLTHLAMASPTIPRCIDVHGTHASSVGSSSERVGTFRNTAWIGLRIYQVLVSPSDGARCSMYPSCSYYTLEAVRRRGPFLGAFMGTARIMATHRDPERPLCRAAGRLYTYAPPEDDEWWRSSP